MLNQRVEFGGWIIVKSDLKDCPELSEKVLLLSF
jgi:hypothetical protein